MDSMSMESKVCSSMKYFQFEDQPQNHSLSLIRMPSLSESKFRNQTDKKSNTESIHVDDDRSMTKNIIDSSHLNERSESQYKVPLATKVHRSLLPDLINKRTKSGKSEITIYFFNTSRKIIFSKSELKLVFGLENRGDGKQKEKEKIKPLLKYFIPYVVKHYCQLFLNFQPDKVHHESFSLKLANHKNKDDGILDGFSHCEKISWLFDCDNLVLVRKKRDSQRLESWQKKSVGTDAQMLEIIIPGQRQMIEKMQKTKLVSALKEKVMSQNQLSKIILLTYSQLKICENKQKIGDLSEKTLQVYTEKIVGFEDKLPTEKIQPQKRVIIDTHHNCSEFNVNTTFLYGKFHIQVLGTTIKEIYRGGIVGNMLGNERVVERSAYTLIGMSTLGLNVKLLFVNKNGKSICSYDFEQKIEQESFLRVLLKLERELKYKFQKI